MVFKTDIFMKQGVSANVRLTKKEEYILDVLIAFQNIKNDYENITVKDLKKISKMVSEVV
jgi:hypothetical protein